MTDDDCPTPEQWAEMRKNGHVCTACNTRVWPAPEAPATALTEEERESVELIRAGLNEHYAASWVETRRLLAIIDRLLSGSSPSAAPTPSAWAIISDGDVVGLRLDRDNAEYVAQTWRKSSVEPLFRRAPGTLKQDLTVGAAGGQATPACPWCDQPMAALRDGIHVWPDGHTEPCRAVA